MREVVIVDGVRTPIGRARPRSVHYKEICTDELGVWCVKELLRLQSALNSDESAGHEQVRLNGQSKAMAWNGKKHAPSRVLKKGLILKIRL